MREGTNEWKNAENLPPVKDKSPPQDATARF